MRKAIMKSHSAQKTPEPVENGNSIQQGTANSSKNDACDKVGKKIDISTWDNSDYIFRNRNNPFNGKDCFFSESTFNLISGSESPFEEKIMSQIARIKSEKQERKQADLNKSKPNKSEQVNSSSKFEFLKVPVVNKPTTTMPLSIDVSSSHEVNIKSDIAGKIKNIKQAGVVNVELTSDTSTDIANQSAKLKRLKQKNNGSELNLQIFKDVSQHTVVLSSESVDKNTVDPSIGTDLTSSCQSEMSPEVINCVVASDSTKAHPSRNLENLVKLSGQREHEKAEQNSHVAVVELLKDAEVVKHNSPTFLPTAVSEDQDANNSLIVAIEENSKTNSEQSKNESSESNSHKTPISASASSFPEISESNSPTNLSIPDLKLNDSGSAKMMEVLKKKAEAPLLEGCSAEEDSSTKYSALSPQAVDELCLIMPSLSSDDDDDDDSEFNDPQCSNIINKPKHNISKEVLDRTVLSENQSNAKASESLTADNASISSSQLPNFLQESASPNVDAFVHNSGDPQSQLFIDSASTVHSTDGMETQNSLVCQQANQENCFGSLHPNSGHSQQALPLDESDIDIPIFSVKEESTPKPTKCFKSAPTNQERQTAVNLSGKLQNQQMSKQTSHETVAAQDLNKNQKFKKSDLTKKEHAIYLQLYNKYVRSFTHAGAPPIMTEKQLKEISEFEKLHKRVSNEQEEFQNYLQTNARKNPSSFVFMKKTAKSYATCKARSYRLKMKYASEFNQALQSQIPFCTDGSSVELRFQRSILEVGIPPRIKLPDVQIVEKPVPLTYDVQKIDTCFPRYSKKAMPGYTHHEPVSLDLNVKQLATKYDFQVVMSSSSVKCLLDNHGPSFDRTWTIPVRVVELEGHSNPNRVVFLDKPLFENDLHIRDYNTLFHKYALRTFVSHPKKKLAQTQPINFQQAPNNVKSAALDDPFDMFSSNVESLETFGAGHSKSIIPKEEAFPVQRDNSKNKLDSIQNVLQDATRSCHGRKLRSTKPLIYKDFDEVNDGCNQHQLINDISSIHADKPNTKSSNLPVKRKRGKDGTNTSEGQLSRTGVTQTVSNTDSDSDGEPKRKDVRRGYPVTDECCLKSKSGSVLGNAEADYGSHTDLRHNSNIPSPLLSSHAATKNPNDLHSSSSRQLYHNSHLNQVTDSPQSPSQDTPLSPTRYRPMSPVEETPLSPSEESPLSPVGETPLSPSGESPLSPVGETPTSPVREIPLSPIKNIPTSPLKGTSLSAVNTRSRHSSQASTRSLSFNRSPDKGHKEFSTLISKPTKPGSDTPTFPGGAKLNICAPLDSILGSCFAQTEDRSTQSKEDPSDYLPPTEVHSSIVYDLWSLQSIKILIRTRCHGVLKDSQNKKSRRIYFSPKMEHQTSYGLEQVTTSEVAKEWTSCFVRPNTNLLRARINAFTSEIMMFEELETSQILRSSLNFKPEDGFKFLDRVLQQILSLSCGKYLLVHEYGDNFCGIRAFRTGPRCEEYAPPKKKTSNENNFRWIPIDPTILLPSHISYKRIPATFLPKDVEVKNIYPEKDQRNYPSTNKGVSNKNYAGTNGHMEKKNKGKKKFRKS